MSFTVTLTPTGSAIPSELVNVIKGDPGDGGAAAVTSVAGRTGAVTLTASDISNSTATGQALMTAADAAAALSTIGAAASGHNHTGTYQPLASVLTNTTASFTTAQETKLGHITVTQAVDLDAIESRVNDLDAAVVLKGTWDASAGTLPGGGAAQAGWSYIVSVAGTVDSIAWAVGDRAIAVTDNASTSTHAGNWFKADYTDQVLSVCGRTGAVSIAIADINDSTAAGQALVTAADAAAQRTAMGAAASGAVTGSGLTMATGRLLGRSTASTGAVEEISVGSGLSLSGGTLSASGASGGASGAAGLVQISDGAGAHTSDTDLAFDATNNRLTVGSGSTTSRGVQIGYMGTSGWGGICQTGVTPSVGTEGVVFNGGRTVVAGSSSCELYTTGSLQLKAAGAGVIEPGGNNYWLGTASLRWLVRASGLNVGMADKTADYTLTNTDCAITSNASGAARTNTLPALSGTVAGQIHIVVKTDSSGNAVSLDANGSETINGSTSSLSTSTQWGILRVMVNADKSGWITW